MVLAVVKLAAPLLVAGAIALRTLTGFAGTDTIGLTNVSGAAGDCVTATTNARCATLFQGREVMWPGKAPMKANVTITYHGSGTHGFGVYLSSFASKSARSSSLCQAADPADKMNLKIEQGGNTVYEGTLSAFAALYHDSTAMLHLAGGHNGAGTVDRWAGNDSSDFTLSVGLDLSADNPYMGCVSTADIAWLAE